jgi:hypothetical protein
VLEASGAKNGGAKKTDRSLAALGKIGEKEAVVWFLGHSGWAVKTQNHLLIFGYFIQGKDPNEPGLCNGHVNPAEMAGEKVAAFASHFHGDHHNAAVFEWRQQDPDISYFLGLQPQNAPPYEYMAGRMEKTVGDLKLWTIPSTDAGVGSGRSKWWRPTTGAITSSTRRGKSRARNPRSRSTRASSGGDDPAGLISLGVLRGLPSEFAPPANPLGGVRWNRLFLRRADKYGERMRRKRQGFLDRRSVGLVRL